MNITLFHAGLEPLFYGVIIFLGLLSIWWKFTRGHYLAVAIEVGVFYLVFSLHGGTMTGGFAATIAALLAGLFFPRLLRRGSST